MHNAQVHIVCLDAPSPPDYGGVYDLYYKIPALAAAGYEIILHYFSYKEERSALGLERYCKEIHTYPRKSFLFGVLSKTPFIVRSRIEKKLIERLSKDQHPIILEGIHCTGILKYVNHQHRKVVVRVHNDEAVYYKTLSLNEKSIFRKLYLAWEAKLLEKYQRRLPKHLHYSFVSEVDEKVFRKKYDLDSTSFVAVFLPWKEITAKIGRGSYCLYQGNLSVAENEEAVLWLLTHVFASVDMPFTIAGKQPSARLVAACSKVKTAELIANPTEIELAQLIQNAHIHLLPSLNNTGVKLKLLHALFEGRFCITNRQGVAGSKICQGVLLAENGEECRKLIADYMKIDFTLQHADERQYITHLYNNEAGAEKLSEFL